MCSKGGNPPVKVTFRIRCVRFDILIGSTRALDHKCTNKPVFRKVQELIYMQRVFRSSLSSHLTCVCVFVCAALNPVFPLQTLVSRFIQSSQNEEFPVVIVKKKIFKYSK